MKTGLLIQRLAVCFVVFASLFSGYYAFFINPPKILIQDDGALRWEERMQPVRVYLPQKTHEVGYLADNERTAQVQEYSFTRYALAPVVVRQGVDYEWIVGNFTQPGFENVLKEQIPSGYTIKNLGAGIYLIHRSLP